MKIKLFLIISFLFFSVFSFSEDIRVGSYTVDLSQKSIIVPVLVNSTNEFVGFQVNITFDPKILSVNSVRTGEFISSFNVLNNTGPGFVRIAGFSPNLQGISGSGTLTYIEFSLLNPGSSNLTLSGKVSNKEGKAIPFSFLSGKIDITGQKQTQQEQEPKQESKEEKKEQLKNPSPMNVPSTSSLSSNISQGSISSPSVSSQTEFSRIEPTFQSPQPYSSTLGYSSPSIQQNYPTTSSQSKFVPPPEDPLAKNNCVLMVISEIGNPEPQNGFHTFKKGDKVECKVEKEVIIGNERYICDGYEGYGSIDDGKENYVSFTITTDTKIRWKWRQENLDSH